MKKTIGIIMLSLAFIMLFAGLACGIHAEGKSWGEAIITVTAIIGGSVVLGVLIIYGLKFLTEE